MLKEHEWDVEKGISRKNFDIFIFLPGKWAKNETNWRKIGVCGK